MGFRISVKSRITGVLAGISLMTVTCGGGINQAPPAVDIDATVSAGITATQESISQIEATVSAGIIATIEAGDAIRATIEARVLATAGVNAIPAPTTAPAATVTRTPVEPSATPLPVPTVTPTASPTPTPRPTPVPVPTPPPTPTPVPTVLPVVESLPDLIERLGPAVVQILTDIATGSGVIIEIDGESGLILTNYHVIEGGSLVDVVVEETATYRATILGTDPARDLAVLKICCSNFSTIPIAENDTVRVGDSVIAMGFPLGVESLRISEGIISGAQFIGFLDRSEFQTDAAINPGNSGGPLVLKSGVVAGLNTYVVRSSAGGISVEGFGFAIAAETLLAEFPKLRAGASVALPTPTAIPQVTGSVYSNAEFGYTLEIPSGWEFDAGTSSGVSTWDSRTFAWVSVTTDLVGRSQYPTTPKYTQDWTLAANPEWTTFEITSENDFIFRTATDGRTSVRGHEFLFEFTQDGDLFDGAVHWFVVDGLFYEVFRAIPISVRQIEQYSALDLLLRLTHVSFRPPPSN